MTVSPFYLSPEAQAALKVEAQRIRQRLAAKRAQRELNELLARVLAKEKKA